MKILVAEDDNDARRILVKVLEKMGNSVIQSIDGKHALDTLLANEDITLFITDIKMPGLDGRELVRLIRKHPRLKKMPIIMVSAIISVNEVYNLLEAGVTWFLPKPLDIFALKELIEQVEDKMEE